MLCTQSMIWRLRAIEIVAFNQGSIVLLFLAIKGAYQFYMLSKDSLIILRISSISTQSAVSQIISAPLSWSLVKTALNFLAHFEAISG